MNTNWTQGSWRYQKTKQNKQEQQKTLAFNIKKYFSLQIWVKEFDIAQLISLKSDKLYCQIKLSRKNNWLKD